MVFYKYSIKEIFNMLKIKRKIINSQYLINLLSIVLAIVSLAITLDDSIKLSIINHAEDYVIIIIVFSLIVFIMLLNHLNGKNDRIFALEADLESETKELWKKYSDLDRFYRDENSRNFMESFVKNNPNLISIQRYNYSIYINSQGIVINISGKDSFIRENADLNTVAQGYYIFNPKDVQDLRKAYALCNQSFHTNNLKDDEYKYLEDLFFDWVGGLFKKDISSYTDDDAMKYQLVLILKELLEKDFSSPISLPFFEEQLTQINRRKSGIEIATFLLRDYIKINSSKVHFEYKGFSDSKKNRLYSNVQVINPNGEKSVFVLAHHAHPNQDEQSNLKQVESDTKSFIQLVNNEINFK